jgi:hypothetical protein
MKQIKSLLEAIVLINSFPKSHQDEQQTLSIPGNMTIFDLAQVRLQTSNIKIIIENNLLKNLTNSKNAEINSFVTQLDLSDNMIENVERNAFRNFLNLQ